MSSRARIPHGHWPSSLDPASLYDLPQPPIWPRLGMGGVFYIQALPSEDNAQGLFYKDASARHRRVSPPGLDLRCRVHEYGGLPYLVGDGEVFYIDAVSQRLYRQVFNPGLGRQTSPRALTPDTKARLRFGDLCLDPVRRRLFAVREDHRQTEIRNVLVSLEVEGGGEGSVLFQDSDFVAAPVVSADGRWLAFLAWSHPWMPWDRTSLYLARLDQQGAISSLRELSAPMPGSLAQPRFNAVGDLYFLADWSGWWNLYRLAAAELPDPSAKPSAVFQEAAEACAPQWQLGQRGYDFAGEGQVVCGLMRDGFWDLVLFDAAKNHRKCLVSGLGGLDQVSISDNHVVFAAGMVVEAGGVFTLALKEPSPQPRRIAGEVGNPLAAVARPRHFSYPSDGDWAHGLFYAPANDCVDPMPGELPPLLVCVHGGPTSHARTGFNPALQFWTSRGYAVLDVNHRGSSGYGRAFREALYGRWGEADISDVIAAVAHLIAEGRVDPERIAIRGGSAGGYVVLAALSRSRQFRAGVSYYGIGDLSLLAADTHKFESHYLAQLIGPWPQAAHLYHERSPINHLEAIEVPVLLMQGEEDKVVPPNQAALVHARLKSSRCLMFPGEGHGFRKPSNLVAALKAELAFYQEVLLPPP